MIWKRKSNRMKRFGIIISIILTASVILLTVGCSTSSGGEVGYSDERQGTVNQNEYVLYQNVFYNGYAKDFDGKSVKKVGVFAVLHDAFNDLDRYYVWGYRDSTKCCDWQWEFTPKKGQKLPAVGSLVTVEGTFVSDEQALDNYWIKDAIVTTNTVYTGTTYDVNMYVMSDTLERVQLINLQRFPDYFKDQTFIAYGRIKTMTSFQDPYYDGSWYYEFTYDGTVPGIGKTVVLSGTLTDGALVVQTLEQID